jgi:Na+/melibiose symporter-like transporter
MFLLLTFLIFCALSLIEVIYIYFKINQIKEIAQKTKVISNLVVNTEKYENIFMTLIKKYLMIKKVIWIPIIVLIVLNLLVSLCLSGTIELIRHIL